MHELLQVLIREIALECEVAAARQDFWNYMYTCTPGISCMTDMVSVRCASGVARLRWTSAARQTLSPHKVVVLCVGSVTMDLIAELHQFVQQID